jgi:polysaccharide deacetylase family protein (PEP-CTERM system associated)
MINALTIDVEEYFHPTEVRTYVDQSQWSELPSRVDDQILKILEVLDNKSVKATFFVLGWLAETRPWLVKSIVAGGHEIGCHSYSHRLVFELTPEEFACDTARAVAVIEDAAQVTPRIYRAPSYSITGESLWALEVLVQQGFTCDSSIYPIRHDRYGVPGFERHATILNTPSGPIQEIPIGTVRLSRNSIAPIGGGGYLRLLPYRYTAAGIRKVNRDEQKPVCVYFHPWEIDPDQPRLARGRISRARTYFGLRGMRTKFQRLVSDFQFSTVSSVFADAAQPPNAWLPAKR